MDQSKLLEKVIENIQDDVDEVQYGLNADEIKDFKDLEMLTQSSRMEEQETQTGEFGPDGEKINLLQSIKMVLAEEVKGGSIIATISKWLKLDKNKVGDLADKKVEENELHGSVEFQQKKYEEKLRLFKFYKACNFYEDNIGKVEIVQWNGKIITTSFKFPSYVQHLTYKTKEEIADLIFKVSQQEKLEAFVTKVGMYNSEMKWQQFLAQKNIAIKKLSNAWDKLSVINFILILIINTLFLFNLEIDTITSNTLEPTKFMDPQYNFFLECIGWF